MRADRVGRCRLARRRVMGPPARGSEAGGIAGGGPGGWGAVVATEDSGRVSTEGAAERMPEFGFYAAADGIKQLLF